MICMHSQLGHVDLRSGRIDPHFLDFGIFFLIPVGEAIGTAATPGVLCQPRVIVKMIVEEQMECRLDGETEVLGENLPQRHFLSITKSHMTRPGFEPGPPRWEAGD
jgi:hypothetical protein